MKISHFSGVSLVAFSSSAMSKSKKGRESSFATYDEAEIDDIPVIVEVVRHCLICSYIMPEPEVYPQDDPNPDEIELDLKTICDALELYPVEDFLDTVDDTMFEKIAFCESCKLSVQNFRSIHTQLILLNHQLSNIRKAISSNLLHTAKKQTHGLYKFRTQLANKFLDLRKENPQATCKEYDDNNMDWTPNVCDVDVPSIELTEIKDHIPRQIKRTNDTSPFDDRIVHPQVKPCEIRLERLHHSPKQRNLNLRKLLKRQNSISKGKFCEDSTSHEPSNISSVDVKQEPKERKVNEETSTLLKCPRCTRFCSTEDLLRFHIRKIHESHSTPYDCSSCGSEFANLKELRNHGRNVHQIQPIPRTFDCENCRRVFKKETAFNSHLKTQGGICRRGEPLPLNSTFDRTQERSKRFTCGECGRKYRSPHNLSIHIRATHTEGFAFLCEYCCKPFKVKQSMIGHQRQFHVEELLGSKKNVSAELEKIKSLTCKICNKTFSTSASKRNHDAKQHMNHCKFWCEVCGSGWMSLVALKLHSVSHSAEKKFSCDKCDLCFTRRDKLVRHIKVKHGTGVKTAKCPECPKSFWNNSNLKTHMTLLHRDPNDHTSVSFRCDICDYTCYIREYLRIHSRTKKHIQRFTDLGYTDSKMGLVFPEFHKSEVD